MVRTLLRGSAGSIEPLPFRIDDHAVDANAKSFHSGRQQQVQTHIDFYLVLARSCVHDEREVRSSPVSTGERRRVRVAWLSLLFNAAITHWPFVFEHRVQVVVNPLALRIAVVNEINHHGWRHPSHLRR